jgi:hypothetical protein
MKTQMNKFTQLDDCQNGFWAKRSSSANLFIVDQLRQISMKKNAKGAYLAFTDFRKAFDSLHVST